MIYAGSFRVSFCLLGRWCPAVRSCWWDAGGRVSFIPAPPSSRCRLPSIILLIISYHLWHSEKQVIQVSLKTNSEPWTTGMGNSTAWLVHLVVELPIPKVRGLNPTWGLPQYAEARQMIPLSYNKTQTISREYAKFFIFAHFSFTNNFLTKNVYFICRIFFLS